MPKVTARLKNLDHPTGKMMAGGVEWGTETRTYDLSKENAEKVLHHHLLDVTPTAPASALDADEPESIDKLAKPKLEALALAEGVDLKGAKNNPERVALILAAREAKAKEAAAAVDLNTLTVEELALIAEAEGVDVSGCIEVSEFADVIYAARDDETTTDTQYTPNASQAAAGATPASE